MSKVALITGSSRGIGKAIALRLAKSGYDVAINYNGNEELAKSVMDECINLGVNAKIYKCNVSSFEDSKELVQEVISDFGKIDCLVNNAGITKDNLLLRMTEEDFDKVIDINLKGTFNMIKHVSKHMLKNRSGKIINLSSVVGVSGNAGQVNYSASKAGVIGITKSCAKEFASRGITVNAVAPGYIETDMTNVLSDEVKENVKKSIPLNRLGSPEDIANTVNFLASDEANYITGQVIHVCGGMLM